MGTMSLPSVPPLLASELSKHDRPHEVPLQCRNQTTPACVLPVLHFSVILKAQGHSSRAEATGLS